MENNTNKYRESILKDDRESLFAELFFANITVDTNITKELLYKSIKEFILKILHLDKSEAMNEDILLLCRISTAKRLNTTLDKLDDVDKPDKLGLTECFAQKLILAFMIEKGLHIVIHDDDFEKIKTIKELSDYVYKILKEKQREDCIEIKSYYHENKVIAKEEFYSANELPMLVKEYNDKGILKSEIGYDEGLEYGCAKHFLDTGELYYSEYYYYGNKEYQETEYYKNGNIKIEEEYFDDLRHGWSKTYNEEGELLLNDLYDEDVLVERYILKTGTVKLFDYTDELKAELFGSDWK